MAKFSFSCFCKESQSITGRQDIMKRLIILVLWVVCMLALLVGCSSQENEIGDIDNHTPIALLDDAVVYNYIDDDGALVIGRYVLSSKRQSDIVSVEEFYISSGKPTVIDNSVILPVTLNTNEHKLLMVNADSDTSEMIFMNATHDAAHSNISLNKFFIGLFGLVKRLFSVHP